MNSLDGKGGERYGKQRAPDVIDFGQEQTKSPFPEVSGKGPRVMKICQLDGQGIFLLPAEHEGQQGDTATEKDQRLGLWSSRNKNGCSTIP